MIPLKNRVKSILCCPPPKILEDSIFSNILWILYAIASIRILILVILYNNAKKIQYLKSMILPIIALAVCMTIMLVIILLYTYKKWLIVSSQNASSKEDRIGIATTDHDNVGLDGGGN